MYKSYFFILYLSSVFSSIAQITPAKQTEITPAKQTKIDSLKQMIAVAEYDTQKIKTYFLLGKHLQFSRAQRIGYNENIISLCQKNLGGELNAYEKKFFQHHLANSLINIGVIHSRSSNYKLASLNFYKAIEIARISGQKLLITNALGNIALIHHMQGQDTLALNVFNKTLKVYNENGNKRGAASTLNNIGLIYEKNKKFEKALDYYSRAWDIFKKDGTKRDIAIALNNIGVAYEGIADFEKAQRKYEEGLKTAKEIDDKQIIAASLSNISSLYLEKLEYEKAIYYGNRALSVTIEEDLQGKAYTNDILYQAYKASGKYKEALQAYLTYVNFKDSIESEKRFEKEGRIKFLHEYALKEAIDSVKSAEQQKLEETEYKAEAVEAALERQSYILYGLLFIILIGVGWFFKGLIIPRKPKKGHSNT